MKNLLLFAILVSLPLLLGGCGVEDTIIKFNLEGVNLEELEVREGIYYFKDTPYTGKSYALYPNGQKKVEVIWKDGKLVEASEKFWNSKGERMDTGKESKK